MKGYQFLGNDFFDLCQTREIGRTPMLIYIYLRGLYCRFQKPVFTWPDKTLRRHLGISQSTLARARQYLQSKELIKALSGKGSHSTEYTMLGTVLLPILKMKTGYRQPKQVRYPQNDDTYNTSKERLNNKVDIFQGTTEEGRIDLRAREIMR
jgi:hypothetical protein